MTQPVQRAPGPVRSRMEDQSLLQSTQKRSFTSLLASRLGRKRRLQSHSELQEASINLINRNQNISALLQETAAGTRGGTHTCMRHVGEISTSVLECELRRQAEEMCVPVSVLSVKMVMERIKALQGDRVSAMMDSAYRTELIMLLCAARKLLNVGVFSPKLFWQEYWKSQPVLEVVYRLHTEELLPLQYTLTSDAGVCVWLVSQLQSLCECGVTDEEGVMRHHILSTVVCVLVPVGFEDVMDSSVSHSCSSVLDSMLSWVLDSIENTHTANPTHTTHTTDSSKHLPAAAVWLCVFKTSVFAVSVSEDAVHRFFTHTLTHILTHQPSFKVSDAIAMQSQWSFAKTSQLMTSLFCKVCVVFSMEEVCTHLQQVLETLEVNWKNVLSCISTLLVYHSNMQACLKELLSQLLRSAFHSYDVEKMITAFLLARQGALEGPAIFPSYSDWFKISFGGASGYHGNSKKSLVFLLKFLSDLVPFDPPQYLKVHVLHPPYVPGKHRSLLQEFISLTRTRLSDLKVSVEQMGMYEVVSGAATEVKPECVAQQDVEKAVAFFQNTGRISATVMEASIFRRPYFLSRFLPALLTPRMLPEKPDNRMAFIEALKKAEKIPAALYSSYIESCMRQQQGAGVCDLKEQDPQMGVQTHIMQLRVLLSSGAAEGEVRAQVAMLSQMLAGVCDNLDKQSECETITLTLDPHSPSHTPPVVNVILQGFCECVLAMCRVAPPNRQGEWVGVFLKMLLGHTQLYTHILQRVLQLLNLQGPSLAPAHVLALAVLVVDLHVCRDQFPMVDLSHSLSLTPSTRLTPSEALSDALPFSTASGMEFSLRFCVVAVCYALCKSSSHAKELTHFIPSRLYKRLLFLMPRLVPELRSGVLMTGKQDDDDKWVDEEECMSAWASVTDCRRSMRSSVKAMWGHTTIRNLQKHPEHQLSFSDWLMFELRVQRSQDALSDTERQLYERWACQQWFLPLCGTAGGCKGNTATACTHIINAVLDEGVSPVLYSPAPPHTDSCRVDILARLQELLWELQFTCRSRVREKRLFLWDLMDQRCSVNSKPKNSSSELELQTILHTCNCVILTVPSSLLVCVCAAGRKSMLDCTALMDHINNHQRRVCSPAGVLSCSLTTHFLSAVLSASVSCESPVEAVDTTLSQLSVRCPLLMLSAVRWWVCVSPVLCSLWERVIGGQQPDMLQLLNDCTQWACRWVRGLPDDVPSAPALVLAVCVHVAVEQQGSDTERVKAKLTLIQQHREVLVFLLFFYITDFLSEHLSPQGDRSVSRAKSFSVQLITLLADSSDWLSLFHQSGSSMEHEHSSERKAYASVVSMVTTDQCARLMPFALFSMLVDVDASILSRLMVSPGFLLPAVMSYTALMKLFLLGHTADVKADTPQQILREAQHIVLKSISLTRPGSITHSLLRQMEAECMELDPEVAAALSALMNSDDL
ncbi:Fanconi anemia group A protein isoform X2 [Hemibagrus wyckioides]|uniref:Fanconi anemia group A protein isoform X2 n=1 Tax=Hemibagrus wyckioides TaxID=337641 RepID=UPI00266CE06A|nr:Fanconi anemia group A protein isoform X2 [Hemibagrus wyckioides]